MGKIIVHLIPYSRKHRRLLRFLLFLVWEIPNIYRFPSIYSSMGSSHADLPYIQFLSYSVFLTRSYSFVFLSLLSFLLVRSNVLSFQTILLC